MKVTISCILNSTISIDTSNYSWNQLFSTMYLPRLSSKRFFPSPVLLYPTCHRYDNNSSSICINFHFLDRLSAPPPPPTSNIYRNHNEAANDNNFAGVLYLSPSVIFVSPTRLVCSLQSLFIVIVLHLSTLRFMSYLTREHGQWRVKEGGRTPWNKSLSFLFNGLHLT